MHIFLGLDPGVSGGIAVLSYTGTLLEAVAMPATERDLIDHLRAWGPDYGQDQSFAMVERVQVWAQSPMSKSASFAFGKVYGTLLTALIAARIPFDEVQPTKWQRAMGCLTGGDKNISKRRAQQLFPDFKVTHATADSLLIAQYCWRVKGPLLHEETPIQQEAQTRQGGEAHEGTLAQVQAINRRYDKRAAQSTVAGHVRRPKQAAR